MNTSRSIRLCGALLACASLTGAAMAQSLKVGSPAPALKVKGWVKGQPVSQFEKGKLYVVEFWATWCGPCRESIPHLTELAKKYKGKVTFVGVDSFERPADNLAEVKKFVKDMGPKMDYNVAVDGSPAYMAKHWMEAANQGGIPTAFIVDRDQKIAWIGHPMEMEGVLAQVVAGKLDRQAVQKEQDEKDEANAQEQQTAQKLRPYMEKFQAAVKAGDFKSAVAALGDAIKAEPGSERALGLTKYEYMARLGDPGTVAYGKHLVTDVVKDDAMGLNNVAWWLVDDDVNFKNPDLDFAASTAEQAVALRKDDPTIMDTLAYVYFKQGKIDKALEMQQRAVSLLDKTQGLDDETKQELRDRLSKYKKAKGGGQ